MPYGSRQKLIAHHLNTERMLLWFTIDFGFAMNENVYQLYMSNESKVSSDNISIKVTTITEYIIGMQPIFYNNFCNNCVQKPRNLETKQNDQRIVVPWTDHLRVVWVQIVHQKWLKIEIEIRVDEDIVL